MSDQPPTTEPPRHKKPRKPYRLINLGFLWVYRALMICLLMVFMAGIALKGRVVAAPSWVVAQVEQRLSAEIKGFDLDFGELDLTLGSGFRPQAIARNVTLKNAESQAIFGLSQMNVEFAASPLLLGAIFPKTMSFSGAFATVLKDEQGHFSLRGGDDFAAPGQTAQSLPQLVRQLDRILEAPAFKYLKTMDIQALTLRYEDLRSQRVWVVDGARLRLEKAQDAYEIAADLALLSGGADVATLEVNFKSTFGEDTAQFGVNIQEVSAQEIATQSPALAWLSVIDAKISGAFRSGIDAQGNLEPLNATLHVGQGVIQPDAQSKPVPFHGARSYFTYDPQDQHLTFDEFSIDSQWMSGSIEGDAWITGLDEGGFDSFVGQFRMLETHMDPNGLFPQSVYIKQADMDFKLQLAPFTFKIGQLQIDDGMHFFALDGEIATNAEGWTYSANGKVDAITPARVLEYWPETLAVKSREWVAENLLSGQIEAADFALRGGANKKPEVFFGFHFQDADVRYLKTMPPIRQARGYASMFKKRFVVQLDHGVVEAPQGGKLELTNSAYIIPQVAENAEGIPSIVRLNTESSVEAVLSLLNQPKLAIMDKAGLPVALSEGRAKLQGELKIPIRKGITFKDVQYTATGRLSALRSSKLVPEKTLVSNEIRIEASEKQLRIWGDGQLGKLPFTAQWVQKMGAEHAGSSRVTGTVQLSQLTNQEFKIGLPKGAITGSAWGEFDLNLTRGEPARLKISSDLAGLGIGISQLGWRKAKKSKGKLEIQVVLGAQPVVERLYLKAPGLEAQGKITPHAAGGLKTARFEQIKVGKWLKSSAVLSTTKPGGTMSVALNGGVLDLRHMPEQTTSGGGSGNRGGPLKLNLDRLRITDDISLHKLQGEFATNQGLKGRFSGYVNGGTAVRGQVSPYKGRSAVVLHSKNAGGVLASIGVLEQAKGGALEFTLTPAGQGKAYNGHVKVKGTRVKDAPAMANLLNAISIVGLLDQLNGSGIYFETVEADFHMNPQKLTLLEASAVGPSMGISMDGYYDFQRQSLDMQGVISPIYVLNVVGRLFAKKGEGLIGFNYNLQGPAKNPKVRVNPLSVLTPGMFRKIFQRPVPKRPTP